MGYEPIMDCHPATNVYGEHVFRARVTFGTGTVSTIRCKDLVVTRPTSTTLLLTLPKAYAEITDFKVGTKAATGTAMIDWIISDDSVTSGTVTLTAVDSNSAGTATAPASGDVAYITLGVSCDVLNDRFTDSTA